MFDEYQVHDSKQLRKQQEFNERRFKVLSLENEAKYKQIEERKYRIRMRNQSKDQDGPNEKQQY